MSSPSFQMIHMKKYIPFLLLSAISLSLLSSCRKKDSKMDMAVSGVLKDFTDDSVIPHATVVLMQCKDRWGATPVCYTNAQTTTDANGRFSFNYRANMKYSYIVKAALNDSIISDPVENIQFSQRDEVSVYATRHYPYKLRLIIHKNEAMPLYLDNIINIRQGPLDTVLTTWGKSGITYYKRVAVYDNTAKMWRGRLVPMKIETGKYETATVEIPDMLQEPQLP